MFLSCHFVQHGWSPLHAAADLGHASVVSEILQHAKQERLKTYPTMTTEVLNTMFFSPERKQTGSILK